MEREEVVQQIKSLVDEVEDIQLLEIILGFVNGMTK